MRVGIDLTYVGKGHGGSETYLVNLVSNLAQLDQEDFFDLYITRPSDRELVGDLPGNFNFHILRPANSWLRVPIGLPVKTLTAPVDLLHLVHAGPPFSPCPYVIMWFDLAYLEYPDSVPALMQWRLKHMIPFSAKRARRVLTPGYFVKNEIIKRYSFPENHLTVTHLGVDFGMFRPMAQDKALASLRQRYNLPDRFMVCVGSLEPRKNVYRLLEALRLLKERGRLDLPLVMIGRPKYKGVTFADEIAAYRLQNEVYLMNFVPTPDLPLFYNAAEMAVYLSLYEGFGLPAAEALACGTPLVTSRSTAIPEVVGDSALSVDAKDVEAITNALDRMIHDTQLRAELRAAGPAQVAKFTWQETARRTLSIWKEVVYERA